MSEGHRSTDSAHETHIAKFVMPFPMRTLCRLMGVRPSAIALVLLSYTAEAKTGRYLPYNDYVSDLTYVRDAMPTP